MKRLLLILAVLLSVAPAYAVTVPPWWMLGQSATDNGVASFDVDLLTLGTVYADAVEAVGTVYADAVEAVVIAADTFYGIDGVFTGNVSVDYLTINQKLIVIGVEETVSDRNEHLVLLYNASDAIITRQTYTECSGGEDYGYALGLDAMFNNAGWGCNAFGHQALQNNDGNDCGGFGFQALKNNQGAECGGFGSAALRENTGQRCYGMGTNALRDNTAENSVGIGYKALAHNNWSSSVSIGGMYTDENRFIEDESTRVAFASSSIDPASHTITFGAGHGFGSNGRINLKIAATTGSNPDVFLVETDVYQFEILDDNTLYYDGLDNAGSADFTGTLGNSVDTSFSTAIGYDTYCTKAKQVILGSSWTEETLLRGQVCVGTNTPMVGYGLTIGGPASDSIYAGGDVNALSFTDRSDAPESLESAYAIVNSHEAKNGKIDHGKLDSAAWGKKTLIRATGKMLSKKTEKEVKRAGKKSKVIKTVLVPEMESIFIPDQNGRNLSMVISAQALVIKDLQKRLEALEKKK